MAEKKKGEEVETATTAETNSEAQANLTAEATTAGEVNASDADTASNERVENNGSQPATAFETSGAPLQVVADVDPSHPAVDNDPRAHVSAESNRIDFNDPTISGEEAVKRALDAQSKG